MTADRIRTRAEGCDEGKHEGGEKVDLHIKGLYQQKPGWTIEKRTPG